MADSCCTPARGGGSNHTHHHGVGDTTTGAGSQGRSPGAPDEPGAPDASDGPRRAANHTVRFEKDMVSLDGGTFVMGTEDGRGFPADGEGPEREITLSPFSIDKYTVTNRQFATFVEETGYKTEAERFGWSYVFHLFVSKTALKRGQVREVPGLGWWLGVLGADWKHPYGKGTSYREVLDHPVVHVSWNDAAAFAKWAGKRLPTEAEWEYAARGGLEHAVYPWGDELTPGGKHKCNIWQGDFPRSNTKADGYASTCPVDSYQPNGFGLYNVSGNVWEWCADYWSPDFHLKDVRKNPQGPPTGNARVTRGGSYLCHHSYCNRYRVAARTSNTPDSSTGNTGFRCAL